MGDKLVIGYARDIRINMLNINVVSVGIKKEPCGSLGLVSIDILD